MEIGDIIRHKLTNERLIVTRLPAGIIDDNWVVARDKNYNQMRLSKKEIKLDDD